MVVLPDVLAEAHAVLLLGQLGEPSDRMQARSMHNWDYVTSTALVPIFRIAEQTDVRSDESNECQMMPAANGHNAGASNESRDP
jgi:hypothetical protein